MLMFLKIGTLCNCLTTTTIITAPIMNVSVTGTVSCRSRRGGMIGSIGCRRRMASIGKYSDRLCESSRVRMAWWWGYGMEYRHDTVC